MGEVDFLVCLFILPSLCLLGQVLLCKDVRSRVPIEGEEYSGIRGWATEEGVFPGGAT